MITPSYYLKTQHIQSGKYFDGSIPLNIENVSSEDEGDYNCVGTSTNGQNYTKTYKLNAYRKLNKMYYDI